MKKRNVVLASVISGSLIAATVNNVELNAKELPDDPTGASPYGSVSFPPSTRSLRTGVNNITVREGTQKVLVLMIEFGGSNPKTFETKPSKYHNSYFGTGSDSIASWLENQSNGKLTIAPAETTQSGMPAGVVKVTINPDDIIDTNVGVNDHENQQKLVAEALKQVQEYIEWEKIDTDGNKVFVDSFHLDYVNPVNEELVVNAIFAGDAETNGTGENGPEAWPHLGPLYTTVTSSEGNEFTLSNALIVTSERVNDENIQTSVLGHEYLHSLGARDMYKDRESIGPWSIMDRCYGNRNSTASGEHLNPIDPVHRISWGWTDITMIPKGSESGSLPSTGAKVVGIQDPKDTNILYLIEYRDYDNHYEKANYRYGLRESGAIVWKLDKRTLNADFLDSDWYLNSTGPKTSVQVLTANANEAVIVENTLQPVGKEFTIPGVDYTFTATEDGKISYELSESTDNPSLGEQVEIFALNRTIKVGDNFDPKEGVRVTAGDGTDLTDKLTVVENTVNVNRPGTYTVTYSVEHEDTIITKTIIVEVEAVEVVGKPTITAPDKIYKVGEKFNALEGVVATDANGVDITDSIEIVQDTVDTSVKGNYIVVYSVTDSSGNTTTLTRVVVVAEDNEDVPDKDTTPPVINGANNKVIYVGDIFDPTEGITALDNVDGDVDVKVVSNNVDTKSAGTYTVVYEATDKAGNSARVTREIRVIVKDENNEVSKDTVGPTINLLDGASGLLTYIGHELNLSAYIEAIDDVDGNVKDTLEIDSSKVDWNSAGDYEVICTAKDKSGNTSEFSFTVKVSTSDVAIDYTDEVVKLGDTSFDPLKGIKLIQLFDDMEYTVELIDEETDLNLNKAGTYTVKYKVTNQTTGSIHTFTRKVVVVNPNEDMVVFPELNLPEQKTVTLAQINNKDELLKLVLEGTNVDTNRFTFESTDSICDSLGKRIISYTITDKTTGAIRHYKLAVNVVAEGYESGKPVINAIDKTIILGSKFEPLEGVTALDAEDGDLTDKIVVVENNVDTTALGSYDVTYSVVDSDRNTTTSTITVKVIEETLGDDKTDIPNSGDDVTDEDIKLPGLEKDENDDGGLSNVPKTGTIVSGGVLGLFTAGIGGFALKLRNFSSKKKNK